MPPSRRLNRATSAVGALNARDGGVQRVARRAEQGTDFVVLADFKW